MSGGVDTGVVLGNIAGDCEETPDTCLIFSPDSEKDIATRTYPEPMQIMAFDIPDGDYVSLEQVGGGGGGDVFEEIKIDGCNLRLDSCNNRIQIPFPGTFRFVYNGQLGEATVMCQPSDCCFAPLFPKVNTMNSCPTPEPLTNTALAAMLAFRTCSGGQVLPGEQLATCGDLTDALATISGPATYMDTTGNTIPDGAVLVTPSDLPVVPVFVDSAGVDIGDGDCIVRCSDFNSYVNTAPNALVLNGTNLELNSPAGNVSMVDLSGFLGGADADGVITDITLNGTDLEVTGTGGAFNGTVDLSSLMGSGGTSTSDGVVSSVVLNGTDLVFTGSDGGFNGIVDLSALVSTGGGGAGGDVTGVTASAPLSVTNSGGPVPNVELNVPALANDLCVDNDFITCVTAIAQTVADATITTAVDTAVNTAVTNALAACIKAGSFSVNFTSGGSSGFVTFDNAFPSGTIPVVVLQDYGNRDGGDSDDEEVWVTTVTNTGFSWASRGDGPTTPFRYIAVEDKDGVSNAGGGTGGTGGGGTGGNTGGGTGSGDPQPNEV